MGDKTIASLLLLSIVKYCEGLVQENVEESRGKKKKIALFVYFADLIIKKIFIFKIIYAIIFAIVLHKAWYFLIWFASYLKEKKQEFKEPEHHHYGPHHHYEEYGPPHDFSSYAPYRKGGYN